MGTGIELGRLDDHRGYMVASNERLTVANVDGNGASGASFAAVGVG